MENYFKELNAVNCSDKVEKKGNLSYLSWAWAWAEVKKKFPDATYTIYEDAGGCFYHTDGRTCWVKTGVTVNGVEHIEYLPVMNNRNRSIPLEQVTSFDVNTSIQRSLTKACARHGLGLYIYAGEDLPEDERPESEKANKNTTEDKPKQEPNPKPPKPELVGEVEIETLKKVANALGAKTKNEFRAVVGIPYSEIEKLTKTEWGALMVELNKKMDDAAQQRAMQDDA